MPTAKRLFSLSNVTCRRGNRVVFQNLSLSVETGEVVHLTGPNGAGKTSFLRIMSDALPFSGDFLWQEENFLENGREAHAARFAFLPSDDRALKTIETAAENLAFWARLSQASSDAVFTALDGMGLSRLKDRPVRSFSTGQKRRLGFARILLTPRPLWLLDEPLNGLDDEACSLFFAALKEHTANGGVAVIAGHQDIPGARRFEMGAK